MSLYTAEELAEAEEHDVFGALRVLATERALDRWKDRGTISAVEAVDVLLELRLIADRGPGR